jgi:hypothetical protein
MNLADLRKISIKNNTRIRFSLSNGMECVMNEHGVAQVPALRAIPDFDLEKEFAEVRQFILEPVPISEKARVKTETVTRDQLAALAGNKRAEATHDDAEE